MILQLFILDPNDKDRVIVDRKYVITNEKAPDVNLQDVVDEGVKILLEEAKEKIPLAADDWDLLRSKGSRPDDVGDDEPF